MAIGKNFYSQLVNILKISLPLAALALMSTVFLLARAPNQDPTIPYAEIEALAQEPGMVGARISGVLGNGAMIELRARTVRPNGDIILAEALSAGINTLAGVRIDIHAGAGEINNTTQVAKLTGLARLITSDGFEVETAGFTADLSTGRITSEGALEAQAPFGTLTAGSVVIETPENGGAEVMLFQNGVRLVYTPQQ